MNYYPFHLGDYSAHTGHLEPMEDLSYRRLLDVYYMREGALPADIQVTAKLVRLRSCAADVESVLNEFFVLTEDGWRHTRCDEEIAKMQDKQAKARASAQASVNSRRAKAERPLDKPVTDVQRPLPDSSTDVELPTPTPTPTPTKEKEITPHTPKGAKPGPTSLKTWLDAVKAKGELPIAADDPVFAYAAEIDLPREFLQLAWREFRGRYGEPDAKRYRDWRAVFRKTVRGNWLKLWYLAEGHYQLTTVGQQAKRLHGGKEAL